MEWKLTSKSKWSQVPSQDAQGLRMWKCLTADELLIKLYGCAYCTFKKMTTKVVCDRDFLCYRREIALF
ncbi:hypothetical protein SCA6_012197 [Theobroma cacao]